MVELLNQIIKYFGIKFGYIKINIQNGKFVDIERNERIREQDIEEKIS